jgi:hypothetical protein
LACTSALDLEATLGLLQGNSQNFRSMPFRAQPPSLNPLDQATVPPDSLVQLLVFTVLNQMCENP